jgi:undecaprenyl-diphosphatase
MSLVHIDLSLATQANAFAAHHDGWEDVARAYASASELLFVAGVVVLGLLGLLLRRDRLIGASVLAVLAAGIGLTAAAVVSAVVDRPRPFVNHPQIHPFLAHAPDPGFPSDHATAAFAIAAVLLLRIGGRAVPVLIAAIALAASRVLVGVHYPGDVLAGALIGTVAALAVCLVVRHPRVSARVDAARTGLAGIRGGGPARRRAAASPVHPQSS